MQGDGAKQLRIEVLPARLGDCLLVECREGATVHRLLIDGGPKGTGDLITQRLGDLPGGHELELLVVSHIDSDHIGGVLEILDAGLKCGDVWFNGFRHLPGPKDRSHREAHTLSQHLMRTPGEDPPAWNEAFHRNAVARPDDDPETGRCVTPLPVIRTEWGLTLTLLSPTFKRLTRLRPGWDTYLKQLRAEQSSPQTEGARYRGDPRDIRRLAAAKNHKDNKAPNGSSIAFLAEYGGHTCLFAADAFATVLYPALLWLAEDCGVDRLEIDAFKLPHHGSRANVLAELFDVVQARHYLVSSNGDRFGHPDDEAIARVVVDGGPGHHLWFNYDTPHVRRWCDDDWMDEFGYTPHYPEEGAGTVLVLPER